MLILQNISFLLPNKDILLDHISLSIDAHEKVSIIGNNGVGKSTLLQLISGRLPLHSGSMSYDEVPYYIPQLHHAFSNHSVAEVLGVSTKINALKEILEGSIDTRHYTDLADDWMIEERCQLALAHWGLSHVVLEEPFSNLSGGQRTKVFLAGIAIHTPKLVLMDEPSNHLDEISRIRLYELITQSKSTFLIVSHDRQLLNLMDYTLELTPKKTQKYGGNYDFYLTQKEIEQHATQQEVQHLSKELRKAKSKSREVMERQQRQDARGKKKQENAGVSRIMMNTLRNQAENSTSKTKGLHTDKIDGISSDLKQLQNEIPNMDKMKFSFDDAALHRGKTLIKTTDVNIAFGTQSLWMNDQNILINSGERIAIKGPNGVGKSSLLRVFLQDLTPTTGAVYSAVKNAIYIDQDYSLIDQDQDVYGLAQKFNYAQLSEAEIKSRLTHFLFTSKDWNTPCAVLSGGERLRLLLCCLNLSQEAPDMIVLDEPTNNLDIQNIKVLTQAVNSYNGTLVVVSHDVTFLNEIGISRTLLLK